MKLNRQNFLERLEMVYPAIAANPVVAHYAYFKISKGKTDAIDRLQAFNGVVLIETQLDEGIENACAIPAEPFLKLLRSLTDKEIELIFKKDEVKVKAKTIKGTFTILDEVPVKDMPISNSPIDEEEILKDLIEGFKACALYVNKDKTAGPSRGVRVDKNIVAGTDSFRVVIYRLDKSLSFTCSIPLKFINEVLRNQSEIKAIDYVEDMCITATLNDGTQIGSSVLLGEYPPILEYFPTSNNYVKVEFIDEEMLLAMERHVTFLSRIDLINKEINVHILNDKCITKSKDELVGELIDEASVVSDDPEVDISFPINPIYLKNIVGTCSCFKYFSEHGLVLLEADKLSMPDKIQYLTQILRPE